MDMQSRIGDYEVLGEIGRGGMGRVYRVRNVISERIEAMKVLLPDLAGNRDLSARFLREIKLLAALDHPHIAPLRTALEVDNRLIMIMELVEGQSVADRLASGALPIDAAISCVDDVLDALDYAHGHGVVHRDIKPANMMLTPQGVVKLMDFGIARSNDDQTLTVAGTTLGSLSYMSPEQVHGKDTDARSDLYSVGISLYQMVTGQLPFKAESDIAIMVAHLQRMPKPPIELQPALSAGLNAVILKAIAKDPADRFQSAREFREALKALQSPEVALAATLPLGVPAMVPTARTVLNAPISADVERNRTMLDTGAPSTANPAASRAATIMPQTPPSQPSAKQGTQNRVAYVLLAGVLAFGVAGAVMYSRRAESTPPPDNAARPLIATPPTPAETALPAGNTSVAPTTPGPGANGANETLTSGAPPVAPPGTPPVAPPPSVPPAPSALSAPSAPSATKPAAEAAAASSPATSSSGAARAGGASRSATPVNTTAPRAAAVPAARAPGAPAQAAPAVVAAPAVNWDQVEDQIEELAARAASINGSLDRMKQQQSRMGLGLRGDVAARQESMNSNIVRAREAARERNAARTPRLTQTAEGDVEFLEKFLGR